PELDMRGKTIATKWFASSYRQGAENPALRQANVTEPPDSETQARDHAYRCGSPQSIGQAGGRQVEVAKRCAKRSLPFESLFPSPECCCRIKMFQPICEQTVKQSGGVFVRRALPSCYFAVKRRSIAVRSSEPMTFNIMDCAPLKQRITSRGTMTDEKVLDSA